MTTKANRPLPLIESYTEPYWAAAQQDSFVLQHCQSCSRWIHPPRPLCPGCGLESPQFDVASGRGRLYAYTVAHTSGGPGFETVPYVVVVVELAEQPGLLTVGNLLEWDGSHLVIGTPVVVTYEHLDDGFVLPQWKASE